MAGWTTDGSIAQRGACGGRCDNAATQPSWGLAWWYVRLKSDEHLNFKILVTVSISTYVLR